MNEILVALLDLAEEKLPVRQREWMDLATNFNTKMAKSTSSTHFERDFESLRNKFKGLKNTKKLTSHNASTDDIVRAKRIYAAMKTRIATGLVIEEDGMLKMDSDSDDEDNQKNNSAKHASVSIAKTNKRKYDALLNVHVPSNASAHTLTEPPAWFRAWLEQDRMEKLAHDAKLEKMVQDTIAESLAKTTNLKKEDIDEFLAFQHWKKSKK